MKKLRIDNPIRFFYPTSDDWSPNFPRNTVEIKVYVYHTYIDPNKGLIRIVVRGADDTLMIKDEALSANQYDARVNELKIYLENKLPNPLTKQWLLNNGWQYD